MPRIDATEDIGFPVVVKLVDGNHGRGVTVNLTNADEVAEGLRHRRRPGLGRRGREHDPGDDHRLFVVNGELIAAARRMPARRVVGDGEKTVAASSRS